MTLPVVLFVGLTTFIRLVAANNDEVRWMLGMNRMRAAYLSLEVHGADLRMTWHSPTGRILPR